MKPGTPGFIGARLREAREARSFTAIALADLIGVSKQAISQYENDIQSPRPEIITKLASTLQVPISYFRFSQNINMGTIFYRSMSATTKAARIRAERRYLWLRMIESYLREYIQFPAFNFPKFDLPRDPKNISDDLIEELAIEVRRSWSIPNSEPINDMVTLLEQNGAIIARDELGADTLDAFSDVLLLDQDCSHYVVLGSDKAISVRSRFDAAHEFAHKILHDNIDKTYLSRKIEYNLIEKQAHRFAAAFLLPADAFAVDFYSAQLDALKNLKSKWHVSIAMMINRAEHLEFISPSQARWLWINLSKRGWKMREPFDDEIEIEQPQLLRKGFELLINERIQTRQDVLLSIPLQSTDIERLANLPAGYLSYSEEREGSRVITLKPRSGVHTRKNLSGSNKQSQIIRFPDKK